MWDFALQEWGRQVCKYLVQSEGRGGNPRAQEEAAFGV